jgi:UDP-N-acetylmuramoyl-L-alanyl-D-glutamate--2,6-diaminopimelate ligase
MSSIIDRIVALLKRFGIFRAIYRIPGMARLYHFCLGFVSALIYRFPSRRMVVIGVTGTKGKTTTCNLIAHILNSTGHLTGMATTVNFCIGDREWVNETKQTMLGRFALQKLLREMADAGCKYAVIETSSEAILQYRHRFIDYDVAVFTNISPEHLERHGSFENYRAAKVKLFEQVSKKPDGMGVYNLDDPNVKYFIVPDMQTQYGFAWKTNPKDEPVLRELQISDVKLTTHGSEFKLAGDVYEMPLIGEFNIYNAASAICVALSRLVRVPDIQAALRKAKPAPGRLEIVEQGQPFTVVVDYAHEPASLEAIYRAVEMFKPKRVIGILGSQGGGRDVWKRAAMGQIAATHADVLILTNEDPYDESPILIINDVEKGTWDVQKKKELELHKIIDRKEAIHKALSLARPGDAVVITGKGGEVWMCVENDRKIPWSDRNIAIEFLNSIK